MFTSPKTLLPLALGAAILTPTTARADKQVAILDVPDYTWYAGCFGTAAGNMMGYWDRNGFPNFYTGPTAGGVAPLNSDGPNQGIRSLWGSKAGFDGRPADKPGHIDDYWDFYNHDFSYSYESGATDPYVLAGRIEHAADCIGDFIGASQSKWADLDGECTGNIDAFSFNFWDKTGGRRTNFRPPTQSGPAIRDIQSGFRNWAFSRGYQADVFSQLADFNPEIPTGSGFTFEDLKAEIDAGYPVMLFLQNPGEFSRVLPNLPRANPHVHGMLAYGYIEMDSGVKFVRYRTSWGSGEFTGAHWRTGPWEAELALRGVVGFHPLPRITAINRTEGGASIKWDGPLSNLQTGSGVIPANYYVIEKSDSLTTPNFTPVTEPAAARETVVASSPTGKTFYRIKLLRRSEVPGLSE
jgi:hypothetical protein